MDNSNQPTQENNQPNTAQPVTPLAPVDATKNIRKGWFIFAAAVLIFLIGLWFGYAIAISAIISALAGRIGLQNKNKPLAITALTFTGIAFLIYTFLLFGS